MFNEEIKKIRERIRELKAKCDCGDELSIKDAIDLEKMKRKLIGFKEIIATAEKLTP